MTETNTKILKKVWSYIVKYRCLLIISLLLAAAVTALTLYVPILVGSAIDNIIDKGRVDFGIVFSKLTKIGVVIAVTAVGQWFMDMINNRITYGVVGDLRSDAFKKLARLPLSYIDTHQSGDIVSRVIADADQFAEGLLMGFTQFFTGVMTILGTLVFMFGINAAIAGVVVVLTPLSLLAARFISKRTFSMFRKQSEVRGEETALIDENINNLKVVKAFARESKTMNEFDEVNERLYKYSLKALFYSSITNPTTRFINNVVYAAVAFTGAVAVCTGWGHMSVGYLASFLSYANQYTKPFNEISGVLTELQNAIACAGRLMELIEAEEERDETNLPDLTDVEGNVEIKNVAFSYTPDKKLIEDMNLSIKAGQRVAIVGSTGCGKTTLINLLMRFYEPDSGSLSTDGTDIASVNRKSVRKSYGMVLQDTWLKSGTVRENITMGKPDATDEEVIRAAKASHAYGFIRRLPDGFDTVIGEDGGGLSQGQKQLLCIARLMLCTPPMLILDEATSSIDTRTEIIIQKAFEELMRNKTSFIVAHRLSTIREADVILVMDKGRIVERGTHNELMEKDGFYSKLYNSQFKN